MSEVNRVKNTLENRFKPHNKNKSLEGKKKKQKKKKKKKNTR
jgi:hypothetical protein